jgi:5-methylthioadenosine/S-adenosylhomocysteine deaminase
MTLTRGYKEDTSLQEWLQEIWKVEAKMDEEAIYWGTKLACLEMIKTGTTSFYDQYWMIDSAVKAVEEMGIRSWHACVALNLKDESRSQAIKEEIIAAYERSQKWNERCRMSVGVHAPYTVSDELIQWCSSFAREKGLTIHIHMSETEQENIDSQNLNGCSPFEHLERLGVLGPEVIAAHCVWLSENDINIMAKYGVTAVHNINSNLKLASGSRFLYNELRDKGVRVCLGTDGCGSSNNLDMRETMKTAALLQKGWRRDPSAFKLQELMQAATASGAEALGLDAGEVAVGKLADLILVDTDNYAFVPQLDLVSNFVYSANSSCVDTVICNGEIVMENRVVPGEKEILENARRICNKLYNN